MKKFFVILMLFMLLITHNNQVIFASAYPSLPLDTQIYSGNVPHFFTHQLVSITEKAFSPQNKLKNYYNRDLLTTTEFASFLESLYNNNYSLVDIYSYLDYINNKTSGIRIYKNRKPFLLSFDDMSFDTSGDGLNDKLILDDSGELATIITIDKKQKIETANENITILESFIKKYPLFSFENARAVICPTGYNGLLGYRTNTNTYKDQKSEICGCKKLVEKLHKLNYHFACHTYNHININYANIDTIKKDLQSYENEVLPITDRTNIFCFPCGFKTTNKQKLDTINSFGYNIFFCVDLQKEYEKIGSNLLLKRMVIDRHTIRENKREYEDFFDVDYVINSTPPYPLV